MNVSETCMKLVQKKEKFEARERGGGGVEKRKGLRKKSPDFHIKVQCLINEISF